MKNKPGKETCLTINHAGHTIRIIYICIDIPPTFGRPERLRIRSSLRIEVAGFAGANIDSENNIITAFKEDGSKVILPKLSSEDSQKIKECLDPKNLFHAFPY